MLSRLPLPNSAPDPPVPGELTFLMETLQTAPVSVSDIKRWTDHDPVLSRVRTLVQQGWGDVVEDALQPFATKRTELSVHADCVLWGSRVVVPEAGRSVVLEELHDGHPGASRMKALARGVVWWPGLDKDVENTVKECVQCDSNKKMPSPVPMHPWEWPSRPWSRLHMDYAGPFMNRMFLLVVDARTKWLEAVTVSAATSTNTIKALRTMFATHGLPDVLVSDNGTPFTSAEFPWSSQPGMGFVTCDQLHITPQLMG